MRAKLFLSLLFLNLLLPITHAKWFGADNYWECILDEMQDVQSDTIAEEAIKSCKNAHPFNERIFIKKKTPWFGVKSASQCVLKYGKKVQSEVGARYIQAACYKLYPSN